ncbi:uncharacterized protein LOC132939471 [Metopolophium dirhodum]|uniref:uncharacterized protein LOC132939471 n=1 Tax=Metopolophium dirhodum TaxID=44670 RepID=UPI002990589F|nr:uncharacterized protein LOC132939471 [Metopolophium dirhodum]
MVRPTALHCVWAFGFCGLYGSFADAVVAKSTNGSSPANLRNSVDGLETSQTRVNQVDGYRVTGSGSDNRVSGKDYGGGSAGGYAVENSYGPPRDYYYDERPEYFSPYDQASHHLQSNGPPPEVIYHQHPNPHLQHHQHGGGEVHNSGELNVQPLLWPLAGIALLGVLSALVKTPLLLQLGHIGRRRRRRDANDSDGGIATETIKSLLEKFNDKERQGEDQKSCIVCNIVASIYNQKSTCVERSICEVMSRNRPDGSETDKRLLTTTIAQVVGNDQIPEEFKKRLEKAERIGRSGSNCGQLYQCGEGAPEKVRK